MSANIWFSALVGLLSFINSIKSKLKIGSLFVKGDFIFFKFYTIILLRKINIIVYISLLEYINKNKCLYFAKIVNCFKFQLCIFKLFNRNLKDFKYA